MFGSVPLKTYLPDGDIDLAVFQGKGPRLRDVWTYELSALLEAEGRNSLNPHRVKDVQIINAEVWHVSMGIQRKGRLRGWTRTCVMFKMLSDPLMFHLTGEALEVLGGQYRGGHILRHVGRPLHCCIP
jgi:hypothetical protein